MAAGWSTEATRGLLSVWGEQNIQSQLDGVVRNKIVYEKVAASLQELGFEYTWKQCRTKVKNLTQAYRKVSKCLIARYPIILSFSFHVLLNYLLLFVVK